MEFVPDVGTKFTSLNVLLFAESAVVVTFVVANAEKSVCGSRTCLDMMIEIIVIGMIMTILMTKKEDEFPFYTIDMDALEKGDLNFIGITREQADNQGLPSDIEREETQEFVDTYIDAFQRVANSGPKEALLKIEATWRSISQKSTIWAAAIVAMADYYEAQRKIDVRMSTVPGAIIETDLREKIAGLIRRGIKLSEENWGGDADEWWDEVQEIVPLLWI
jgi:hypothetical protein